MIESIYLKIKTPKIAMTIPIEEIKNPIDKVLAKLYFSLSTIKV